MKYTPTEITYLENNYADKPAAEIAQELNCTVRAVYMLANKRHLRKSDDFLRKMGKKLQLLGRSNRFKKGNTPANKGKKTIYKSEKTQARQQAGQYHKGHLPHNAKHNGYLSIRADGYVWFRISKAKWAMMHRLLWEAETGETLTKEDNIIFKDGNRLNIIFNNLEKLTHAELMQRNGICNYPPELRQTLRINAKLKKQINKIIKRKEKEWHVTN